MPAATVLASCGCWRWQPHLDVAAHLQLPCDCIHEVVGVRQAQVTPNGLQDLPGKVQGDEA